MHTFTYFCIKESSMKNNLQRYTIFLGHLVFLILSIMSFILANERVLNMDPAYQLFYDINNQSILLSDHRYSMILSQLLPFLMIKCHAPLQWVLYSYSFSFILITYIIFIIVVHGLKNYKAGCIMILSFICMRATFFHSISETFQLIFYASFFYAWWQFHPRQTLLSTIGYYFILFLSMSICIFIHPIAVFFIAFVIGFSIFQERFTINRQIIIGSIFLLLLFIFKLSLTESGSHDASFIPDKTTFKYILSNFFHLYSLHFFYHHFISLYLFPSLLCLITSCIYIRKKQWLKLLFTIGFISFFFLLSVVVYYKGDGDIGMERTYLPLIFFIGIPFFEDSFPCFSNKQSYFLLIFMGLLTLFSLYKTYTYGNWYSARLQKYDEIAKVVQQTHAHHLIIKRNEAAQIIDPLTWETAIGTIIYSAIYMPDNIWTLFIEDDDYEWGKQDFDFNNGEYFLSVNWWRWWSKKDLNPRYFTLPPEPYKILSYKNGNYYLSEIPK